MDAHFAMWARLTARTRQSRIPGLGEEEHSMPLKSLCLLLAALPTLAFAQACPERSLYYWQAFPAGGESDISGRHQQAVLKKRCPAIETIIQYKPGAGGGLMWSQMNTLPADGYNIIGINLPHIVLQPMEGQVQYRTDDVTPVYWYHYTPDALVVAESSPIKTFQDFVQAAKAQPDRITLGARGSTRQITRRTSGSTPRSASRRPTFRSKAPAI
jgi:tripartite-type tricarboxylate transporter receptor subunit TctC